jgi:hypothetical protein
MQRNCRWEHLIDDATEELSRLQRREDERRRDLLSLEHGIVDARSALTGLCAERDAAQVRALTSDLKVGMLPICRNHSSRCLLGRRLHLSKQGL